MEFGSSDTNESPSSKSSPPPNRINPSSPQPRDLMSRKRKAGRKKFKETRHPIYHGVRKRNGDRWVCEVREPNKKTRIWLGTYPSPEMAARAHDVAVLALKGTSASFNFPDSPLVLPLVSSSSPTHLREAAAKAAEAFKPTISCVVEGDKNEGSSKTMFLDEEALYNMPGLLDSMAEGMLITPPSMKRAMDWDDIGHQLIDLNLWEH